VVGLHRLWIRHPGGHRGYTSSVSRDRTYRPVFPAEVRTAFHDGVLGRMRVRSVGEPRPGVPEIVMIQGMTVSDYLLPGLGALSAWTRTHLVELPGGSGSGPAPHPLTVAEYALAAADWLGRQQLGRVVLAGHSSGTQVAAETALLCRDGVAAVLLAGPAIDPAARGGLRVFARWWADRRNDPKSLDEVHKPERQSVGFRWLFHVLRAHLRHDLEKPVAALPMPVLIIRGRADRLGTQRWGRRLAALAPDGRYAEVPGTHSFCWRHPDAWSPAIREVAGSVRSPARPDG
jgi:pimeloyl-ACP methyl ester carboxylesterase